MRDILRDLYYGNYAAFERTYSCESEQAKAPGIVVDLEKKLRSMLSEEQKALFKQYDDAVADMASAFQVLDKAPEKKRGMGEVICTCPQLGVLKENVLQIPIWYI